MSTKSLYVIGNGFDLHHGLATSFADFKEFVRWRHPELQSTIEEYLCELSGNWNNLEEALAYFNVDQMREYASNFLASYATEDWSDSYHHDYQYEIDQVVQAISSELKDEFYSWINQIHIPSPDKVTNVLRLDSGANFLNFNYTLTLQKLYLVDESRVLHVHGKATDDKNKVILGHGWAQSDRLQLNIGQTPEEIDTRVMQGNEIIESYFKKTFKPADELIKNNSGFFSAIEGVTDVYVWGHSLSAVDLPYFSRIASATASTRPSWHVSHHSDSSIPANAAAMASIGVDASIVFHHKLSEYVEQSKT